MTTFARLRRDPTKGKKEFSAHRGFTIIELMIAIAVLAIITSLALPSYRAIVEKRQVTSGAEQLSAFLSEAQMESVKRNREVAIRCTSESGRCESLLLAEEPGQVDESLRILEFADLKAEVVEVVYGREGANQLTFDPVRGMLTQSDIVTSPIEIQLSSRQAFYALNIRMSPTGRISMCSDLIRADKSVPGYAACS